jgi:hypothetical protein
MRILLRNLLPQCLIHAIGLLTGEPGSAPTTGISYLASSSPSGPPGFVKVWTS